MSDIKMELRRAPDEHDPHEPGWYYARYVLSDGNPHPYLVMRVFDGHLLVRSGSDLLPLDDFAWFGAVPTCKESGT